MLIGIMKTDVRLLGTDLRLTAGQRVRLESATNLPEQYHSDFFATPIDAVESHPGILIDASDVTIVEE